MRAHPARVICALKRSRSTASAPPAGTRVWSAARITNEPSRRISSFRRPTALASAAPRNEFEHTSSHRPSLVCAGVRASGFCSSSRTRTPALGELRAPTSQPARPAPTIVTAGTVMTGAAGLRSSAATRRRRRRSASRALRPRRRRPARRAGGCSRTPCRVRHTSFGFFCPPPTTRNGCLHCGHGSATGFCQSLKSHFGYVRAAVERLARRASSSGPR